MMDYEAPSAPETVSTRTDLTADGTLVIHRSQDVEPLLDRLAALRNETTGKSASGELYHVGDIPVTVIESYLFENSVSYHDFLTDDAHIKRILTNPDFSKFRVWQGRF